MSAGITLPGARSGRQAPPDLAEQRAQMRAAADAGVWRTARPPLETRLGGVRVLRFQPAAGAPRGHVLQFHGGGFRIGLPEYTGPYAEALADRCQVEVIAVQYRLAPEHPFPAGIIDALEVLAALRAEVGDAPVIVSGDSAGGGVAASLGVLASAQGGPRIDGLVLLSPWLDLTVSAPAYQANAATDPLFSKEAADVAAELYLQGFDPTHPLASPLLAPIASYPPTLISVGTGEVLRDDALRFHEKLLAAGVRSELSAIDGMEHVAVVRDMALTGSAETFDKAAGFIAHIVAAGHSVD